MENILEINNLCKTYIINKRQNNVLKNISFSIEKGEMTAVMGPSGSGKSTLLYAVSGMDNITAGSVKFLGKELGSLNQKELADVRLEKMGFIFQQMHMLKSLTVLDNILLPSYQQKDKVNKKQKSQKGQELMRKMGIIDIADNDINEVSGGQLQRACICRSMINSPEIIFADEPTGALNRAASDEVMEELVRLNNEGTSIMLVTHDVKVAARCKRVLFIVDGNIKGEYNLNENKEKLPKDKEKVLNNWLLDMGW